MNTLQLIVLIGTFSGLLPLLVGLLNFQKANRIGKLFIYYIIISNLFNISSYVLSLSDINNIFLFNIYSIFEPFFIIIFYLVVLNISLKKNKIQLLLLIWFSLSILLQLLFNSNEELIVTSWAISNVSIISIILYYFYEILNKGIDGEILDSYLFWISIGFLLYFTTTLLLFISTSIISTNTRLIETLWNINNLTLIASNTLIAIGLWKLNKK